MYRIIILVVLLFSTSTAEYQFIDSQGHLEYDWTSELQYANPSLSIEEAPCSIVTLDYNNDGLMDYIETTHSEADGSGGYFCIYENLGLFSGIPRFDNATTRLLGAGTYPQEWSGFSVADVNNDGYPDILFTHQTSPVLLVYNSSGDIYENVVIDQESGIIALFENTNCSSWSEYYHDCDLDLYLVNVVFETQTLTQKITLIK
ncbi:MAG: VCBS repeat-containing protein [bacterium]|nr:VCBS repeat-containing protein [bacterium]